MAEGTEYADGCNMEDWNFEEDMVEKDVRGYLYEPQYSDEQLRAMEEQEAAEAAATTADLPAADEEPAMARAGANWWCLCSNCAPMDTEQESVCCREFQRCQFLLDEITESEDDTETRVSHPIWIVASWRPTLEYLRSTENGSQSLQGQMDVFL
ncbi:hypothetical protein AALO_G00140890 [Alosa alosa]|uniref:P2X purinoreceptor 7 intracellular domain-containing protein n=1 Tax=Alosa alosa TaxID=278164 RepID=A0AAV6GK63_9TELE|nr:hypothetical protein AALO_G00140890 [Alosa alosa]